MERERLNTIKDIMIEALQLVPSLELSDPKGTGPTLPGKRADLEFGIRTRESEWLILVEWKNNGEPRYVRAAVQQMAAYLADTKQCIGIIAAPYLGSGSRQICSESGLGFVDLAGNMRIVFDNVYIDRDNYPKPESEIGRLKSLFAIKSSRVVRLLLESPERVWRVQEIAEDAAVSIGLAYKVKERLLDMEMVVQDQNGVMLKDPRSLLGEWITKYSYRKNRSLSFYADGSVAELEDELGRYCTRNTIDFAFTLFSGAERVAPFSRYVRGFAYVNADPVAVAKGLDWKRVDSGANFTLLTPFDESLLWNTQLVDGDRVVSDLQLYIDLASYKGRGEEAASFLFEQRIKPKW